MSLRIILKSKPPIFSKIKSSTTKFLKNKKIKTEKTHKTQSAIFYSPFEQNLPTLHMHSKTPITYYKPIDQKNINQTTPKRSNIKKTNKKKQSFNNLAETQLKFQRVQANKTLHQSVKVKSREKENKSQINRKDRAMEQIKLH